MTPSPTRSFARKRLRQCVLVLTALAMQAAFAQQPTRDPGVDAGTRGEAADAPASTVIAPPAAAADAEPAAATGPIAALAWLSGCWQGSVNQREFREQWLPLRGGMLVGAGQSVLRGKMQDYEFLRIESRADSIVFTQFSGDRSASSFRLAGTTVDDKDTIFTFANTADTFPARLIYRRGTEGWLYETIEGTMNGAERTVIYPMRRVDCETGEMIAR
ncbi:MAG: DUF6265 family protein [Betaproteobacteria bacterium]